MRLYRLVAGEVCAAPHEQHGAHGISPGKCRSGAAYTRLEAFVGDVQ
jgi:hypothetical protein